MSGATGRRGTRPPTLRIVGILRSLQGDAVREYAVGDAAPRPPDPAAEHEAPGATERSGTSDTAQVTIGALFARAGHAGFGVVIALLAIVSIPLVGLTLPIAAVVAVVGIQMVLGLSQPWLPQFIRGRAVSVTRLQGVSTRIARWSSGMQRFVQPRLPWLLRGPGWILCGVGVTLQGLALGLPLPGADWLFVLPLVLYGVALLESDGLLILVCHALTVAEVVTVIVLSRLIAQGFADAYRWCAGALG